VQLEKQIKEMAFEHGWDYCGFADLTGRLPSNSRMKFMSLLHLVHNRDCCNTNNLACCATAPSSAFFGFLANPIAIKKYKIYYISTYHMKSSICKKKLRS